MLLLNNDKTELFVAANPGLMNILSDISITIGNTVIRPSLSVRNLGVTFDSAMTMSNHISSILKTLNFHLRNLSGSYQVLEFSLMKQHVTMQSAHSSLRVLIYANSLLKGLSGKEISRLQRLQNRAAKLIFMAKKSDHVFLEQLHWLPVHKLIDFKMLTIIFKCYSDCAPYHSLSTKLHWTSLQFRLPDVNKAKNSR